MHTWGYHHGYHYPLKQYNYNILTINQSHASLPHSAMSFRNSIYKYIQGSDSVRRKSRISRCIRHQDIWAHHVDAQVPSLRINGYYSCTDKNKITVYTVQRLRFKKNSTGNQRPGNPEISKSPSPPRGSEQRHHPRALINNLQILQ